MSNIVAFGFQRQTGAAFFHPFADPDVVAVQGNVGLEILDDLPDATTVLVAMGGGLITGATAIKTLKPGVRVVGIEAKRSPVLLRSLEASQEHRDRESHHVGCHDGLLKVGPSHLRSGPRSGR